MRFFNFINGPCLSGFLGLLLALSVLGPVSAWGSALAVRDCPPVDPASPNVLPPCETRREPMTLADCEAARAAMQASGSAEAVAADLGTKKGHTIRIVCESNSYSFTVPSE